MATYLVEAPTANFVKVGYWTHDLVKLCARYISVYGKDTKISLYPCDNPRQVEKDFFNTFDVYRIMVKRELFDVKFCHAYKAFLSEVTGNPHPVVLNYDYYCQNQSEYWERIENHRRERNLSDEQIAQNKANFTAKIDKFCIVSADKDIQVAVFMTSARQGYEIADHFSTYYGPTTRVYYTYTKPSNLPDKFKKKIMDSFVDCNNVWAVFDRKFLAAYVKYIQEYAPHPVYIAQNRNLWKLNEIYDPTIKNSRRLRKITCDEERMPQEKLFGEGDMDFIRGTLSDDDNKLSQNLFDKAARLQVV